MRSVIGALLIGVPLGASADELPQGFSGKGQAGYVMSRGNSDSDAANAKIDLFLLTPEWKHQFTVEGLYGRSGEVTSAERWDLRQQSDYTISESLFGFGALAYQDDRFSGFQYQETLSTGAGYSLVKLKDATLDVQVGVGYRRLRPELIDKDHTGEAISRTPLEAESGAVIRQAKVRVMREPRIEGRGQPYECRVDDERHEHCEHRDDRDATSRRPRERCHRPWR